MRASSSPRRGVRGKNGLEPWVVKHIPRILKRLYGKRRRLGASFEAEPVDGDAEATDDVCLPGREKERKDDQRKDDQGRMITRRRAEPEKGGRRRQIGSQSLCEPLSAANWNPTRRLTAGP